MRLTRRQSFTTVAAGLVSIAPPARAAATGGLVFVLVNDVYRIDPDTEGRGGFAKLATVLAQERRRAAAEGRRLVFVHAGDTLSPSLLSGFDEGAHMIALFNDLGLDVFVPGNHEFDFGTEVYLRRMGEARFQVLAANLRDAKGGSLPGHRDQLWLDVNGGRVALIGAAYDKTARLSHPDNVVFTSTVETVRREVAAARAAGADLVVAVIHADRADGRDLLAGSGADLILSGHNHDLFMDFNAHTQIAESAYDAQFVTVFDADVTHGAAPRVTGYRAIDTAKVAPDPAMADRVAAYKARLGRDLDQPLARLAAPLDSHRVLVRSQETAIGDLFADALRQGGGAEVAILNGGSIRGDRAYPAGTVLTRRDILTELPFHNRMVVTRVTGTAIRAALENGLAKLGQPSGAFPQVSGVDVEVEAGAPAGRRVRNLSIGGVALDPARLYRVATNDFMARGGDGYGMLAGAAGVGVDSGNALVSQIVMEDLEKRGTIVPKVEERLRMLK